MKILFVKYHGTGNDFIIIDNRFLNLRLTSGQISFLCDRHVGIGADGLMLLLEQPGYDFAMTYFNSDGNESTMCGNGGRCMTAFAKSLGLIGTCAHFLAVDGGHKAEILDDQDGTINRLKMNDSRIGDVYDDGIFLNTGSPHFVKFVKDVSGINVFNEGRAMRNEQRFMPGGTNVDFTEICADGLFVRTYERGVENETLSCGTGVTAAALACAFRDQSNPDFYQIVTPGGRLKVDFVQNGAQFSDIWLEGPATFVFAGEIEI